MMPTPPTIGHVVAAGRRLAFRDTSGEGPVIMFLPGYMSDMEGAKAVALEAWATANGRAFRRFDYGGCGSSDGDFADQDLSLWRDDVLAMIDDLAPARMVLVGSSMGGWLMLLAALARPERIAGLIGIAAAPDFTDWGFTAADKDVIRRDGVLLEQTEYGDDPIPTTRAFWDSGEANKLLDAEIALDCPIRLLHGQADVDVPHIIALRLAERLRSSDVQTILIKDGDHRLSRDPDLAILAGTLANLLGNL